MTYYETIWPKTWSRFGPATHSMLPCHELSPDRIKQPGVRIRPFNPARGFTGDPLCLPLGHPGPAKLQIDSWTLFHAAKKSELAQSFSADEARLHAIGTAVLYHSLFDWTNSTFALRDKGASLYKDSSRTYLAGRFAEGVAHLMMYSRGYIWWDHLPSLYLRALRHASIEHAERTSLVRAVKHKIKSRRMSEEPDFIFEDGNGHVALMESKGSFVTPGRAPNIKGDLAKALDQAIAWSDCLQPIPDKSYAIGTYFREASDSAIEKSLIAFVDPAPDGPIADPVIRIDADLIRRGNYGAWLAGMGFVDSGNDLRSRLGRRRQPYRLPVIQLGHRSFAFVVDTLPTCMLEPIAPVERNVSFWDDLQDVARWIASPTMEYVRPRFRLLFHGMEVNNLRRVSRALENADDRSLLEAESISDINLGDGIDMIGSIFPDGSLLAVADLDRIVTLRPETDEFLL